MTVIDPKIEKVCAECGSNTTYIDKKGSKHWRHRNGKTYCMRCHARIFDDPKWNPINNPKLMWFKGKRIYLKENPRKGKCKKCGKVAKKTDMHHKKYDDSDPLKYTQELCVSCHNKTRSSSK